MGSSKLAAVVAAHQAEAVDLAVHAVGEALSEQGLDQAVAARLNVAALVTPSTVLLALLEQTESRAGVARLAHTLVADAGRSGQMVDFARRPAVQSYVRVVNPPCCGRCAVLAGRAYPYSTGFRRHPVCDCTMAPSGADVPASLITDPQQLARAGKVRGLSRADEQAVSLGAAVDQVVNVRRRSAGLTVGSSVLQRGRRPTPEGILRATSDREQQLSLLRVHGYLA
ncbi:VG15 protein [Auraticoccus monumenti]|uniref:VG15 protein n=1 Tax=Auraticoccus monumenti TaxID=675864 RepID=UPI0012FCE736|nr:hypothetical protein [Auraticoccus monumenti]